MLKPNMQQQQNNINIFWVNIEINILKHKEPFVDHKKIVYVNYTALGRNRNINVNVDLPPIGLTTTTKPSTK